MAISITINIDEGSGSGAPNVSVGGGQPSLPAPNPSPSSPSQPSPPSEMGGGYIGPFPNEMVAGYLSHFVMAFEFLAGDLKGRILSVTSPPATQTVAWGQPFIYRGSSANHAIKVPIPEGCTLPSTITERDFVSRPAEYFEEGKETVWLQILNLDAQMSTELGPIRIILGETVKREYPEIFQPSLGVAQSLGRSGFPARLFFNPIAIVETPFGAFRATHGTLSYGRINGFPPIGTPVTINDMVPLEDVDEVRNLASRGKLDDVVPLPTARIIALSHPIDVGMQISGAEAFHAVETNISKRNW